MTKSSVTALRVSENRYPGAQTETPMLGGTLLGVCAGGEHPTLRGRAHIRWTEPDGVEHEAWLAQLHGCAAKRGDRVLLTVPDNHDEPVLLGVLDGLSPREEPPAADQGPLVELAPDEALRVAGPEGEPLLEVRATADGPLVRLLASDVGLRVPGTFRVSADDIAFEARSGEVRIDAAGDVKVTGEIVRLN